MLGVVLVDLGLAASVLGLVGLVRPLRRLGLPTRRRALALLALGIGLSMAGALLPAPLQRVAEPVSRLDHLVPAWHFAERHEIRIAAGPARVEAAIREVTAEEIRLFRALTWLRNPRLPGSGEPESILAPPAGKPILDVALGSGFQLLAAVPERELVIGSVVLVPQALRRLPPAEIARLRAEFTPEKFAALTDPGYAKAVMNFRIEPLAGGATRLTTETRVFATDATARRRFAAYWRLIYPGSALIRRQWLAAIRRRAEGRTRSVEARSHQPRRAAS